MKTIRLLAILWLLTHAFTQCKKDDASGSDQRDKFVGTWKGTSTMVIPDLMLNQSESVTYNISKSTVNSNQIIITSPGSSEQLKANVNGNVYTYDDFTYTETDQGMTVVITFKGGGSINGNLINEQGTLKLSVNGMTYNGTWSSTLNKQ